MMGIDHLFINRWEELKSFTTLVKWLVYNYHTHLQTFVNMTSQQNNAEVKMYVHASLINFA